jgi:hypothetical protein
MAPTTRMMWMPLLLLSFYSIKEHCDTKKQEKNIAARRGRKQGARSVQVRAVIQHDVDNHVL